MTATGDLDFLAALLADPTLTAGEAARFLGVPVPAHAVDDEPGETGVSCPVSEVVLGE